MRWGYFVSIILSLLVLFGCAPPGAVPPPGEVEPSVPSEEVQPEAEPSAPSEGAKLVYQRQTYWPQAEFSNICADKAGFEEDFKVEMEALSQKYRITIAEFAFSLDQETHTSITECCVDGAISKSADKYRGRFGWLLEPLGLDLINDNFQESKTGLSWEGTIKGITISIKVECPPQDCVYEAWQEPVGHCHQHIWWPVSSQKEMVKCIEIRSRK